MAFYIKGNRILSEQEHNDEELSDGCASMFLLILAVVCLVCFILSPGIIITSLLSLGITFTTSQLWGCAIAGSIVVAVALALIWGFKTLFKSYLITAVVSTLFVVILSLFNSNNFFLHTVCSMFDYNGSSSKFELSKDKQGTGSYNENYSAYTKEETSEYHSVTTDESIDGTSRYDESLYAEEVVTKGNQEDVYISEAVHPNDDGYNYILSERKLQEADLEGKTAKELEIMRNSIYARYGYKFRREDLFQYFSIYSWYRPITSDMNVAYVKMSDVEHYNIDFIKRHEQ